MKKILNPWIDIEGYNCFGCAPGNQHGLQMEFYENGDEIVNKWTPEKQHQGWLNTLHGGIQCALLDEIAAWVVIKKLKTCGVTSRMDTRFLKPVDTTAGEITIRAKLKEMKRNIAIIEAQTENGANEICAKATIYYYTFSQEVAKEKYYFKDLTTE